MAAENILVLVGGGSCTGINCALHFLNVFARESDYRIGFVRGGFRGLAGGDILWDLNTEVFFQQEGSCVGTSRLNLTQLDNATLLQAALAQVEKIKPKAIVAIGGDDTCSLSARLWSIYNLPMIAMPKTLDGDLVGTSATIGFASAVQRAVELIEAARATWRTQGYVGVVETLGRHTGHVALQAAAAAAAHYALIPEILVDRIALANYVERMHRAEGYVCIVTAENVQLVGGGTEFSQQDEFGNVSLREKHTAERLAKFFTQAFRTDVPPVVARFTQLGDAMRGGSPIVADRMLARQYSHAVIQYVQQGCTGVYVAMDEAGRIVMRDLKFDKAVRSVTHEEFQRYFPLL